MKKNVLLLSAVIIATMTYAQDAIQVDTTKFYIAHIKDEMTDQDHFYPSMGLVCANDNRKTGFRISPFFKMKKGKLAFDGLMVKSVGIGACVENSELIFLFEDGSKVNTKAWNKFNCDGESFFDLDGALLTKISKPVKAIRFTNGRSFDSYTKEMIDENRNYFVDVKSALDKQLVVDVKK